MKIDLVNKLADKQSSSVAGATARPGNSLAFAHFLGLPDRVTEAVKAAPSKVKAVAASALRKPAASLTPAAKHEPAQRAKTPPAAPKATAKASKAARRQSPAMPFSEAMNGFKPTARDQLTGTTERWHEVVNGVATGEFIVVTSPVTRAPKVDASAIARRIIAAGEKAAGHTATRAPTNPGAASIIAAGERARGTK